MFVSLLENQFHLHSRKLQLILVPTFEGCDEATFTLSIMLGFRMTTHAIVLREEVSASLNTCISNKAKSYRCADTFLIIWLVPINAMSGTNSYSAIHRICKLIPTFAVLVAYSAIFSTFLALASGNSFECLYLFL